MKLDLLANVDDDFHRQVLQAEFRPSDAGSLHRLCLPKPLPKLLTDKNLVIFDLDVSSAVNAAAAA